MYYTIVYYEVGVYKAYTFAHMYTYTYTLLILAWLQTLSLLHHTLRAQCRHTAAHMCTHISSACVHLRQPANIPITLWH